MATNFKALLDTLTTSVESVEEAKSKATDSPEAKAARQARSLLSSLAEVDGVDLDALKAQLAPVMAHAPSTIDFSEGEAVARRLSALLSLDPEDRPASFAAIADDASSALDRWRSLTMRRRSSGGGGNASTPPSQLLRTFGIKSVRITLTRPDGASSTVEHSTHFSSLTDQITKVVKSVLGAEDVTDGSISFGKVDPTAREAWRAAKEAMRAGEVGPFTFSVNTGPDTGVVGVSIEAIR
jgi:hypothetical protein